MFCQVQEAHLLSAKPVALGGQELLKAGDKEKRSLSELIQYISAV